MGTHSYSLAHYIGTHAYIIGTQLLHGYKWLHELYTQLLYRYTWLQNWYTQLLH